MTTSRQTTARKTTGRQSLAASLIAVVGLACWLQPTAARAQAEPVLTVDLEPLEITVGGRVEATLTLVWTGGEAPGEPRFPAWQDSWGQAEVLTIGEVGSSTDSSGRLIYSQQVVLTAFSVGQVRLPSLAIAVPIDDQTLNIETPNDLTFTVASVLPPAAAEDGPADPVDADVRKTAEETVELRPAVPPLSLGDNQTFAFASAALAMMLGLASWWMFRRLQFAGQLAGGSHKILLAPLEELLERLRQVDPEAGSEPAHTGLSLALRGFLGRSFGFHGLESTTTEIRRLLRDQPLPPAINQRLLRLLDDCDEVKFARHQVADRTTDERLQRAEQLGREIDRALLPVEEPLTEAAG